MNLFHLSIKDRLLFGKDAYNEGGSFIPTFRVLEIRTEYFLTYKKNTMPIGRCTVWDLQMRCEKSLIYKKLPFGWPEWNKDLILQRIEDISIFPQIFAI